MSYAFLFPVYNMTSSIKDLPLAEVDEKNKMMVVRVSVDLYELLRQEAEHLDITVSAMVRLLLSFNYYPTLLNLGLEEAQHDLTDQVEHAQLIDSGLAEYEARLSQLSEQLGQFAQALTGEQNRVGQARRQILDILKTLTIDSDK